MNSYLLITIIFVIICYFIVVLQFQISDLKKKQQKKFNALIEPFVFMTVVFATYDELWKSRTGSSWSARM